MNRLVRGNSGWIYPLVIGIVVGVLAAGLTYRIAPDITQNSAGPGFEGGPTGAVDGAAPLPGESGAAVPGAVDPQGNPIAAAPRPGTGVTAPGASGAPGAPGTQTGSGGSTRLTASDVGVSSSTIKIGVSLLNLGAASASGAAVPGFDPKVQRRQWEVWVKELNDRGGILGRKIQAVYRNTDVTSPQDQQAACVEFTQTHRVFLVFDWGTSMGPEGELCVAAQNRTLVIGGAISPADYYRAARGLLISTSASGTRAGRAWARTMQKVGRLKGRTLGLLVDQGTADNMLRAGLVAELNRLGYKITYKAVVSSDPSQGPSQVPPQVLQMQRAGVDTVFMASAFYNMTSFVNQAEKQGWRPQYAVSDLLGADVATLLQGMPDSFDGAVATTYYPPGGDPAKPPVETATNRECRQTWNKQTGENVKPTDGDAPQIVGICVNLRLLETAATKAGAALNRQGFSNAVQGLGRSFDLGGMGGHFAVGKTDYADIVRTMVWGPASPKTVNGYCTANRSRCFNDGIPPYDPGV